jgi:homoserine dehydrogenase
VAKHGPELMEIAKEKNINFLFEASCGGGIPIIRALNSSLTADEIDELTGILNGTTNYMLYKMSTEGCDFDSVLKEAQQMGYAEADPTADVEGYDACRKIAILSSLAYGKFLNYEDIYTEGITKITPEDMEYARELGMNIKLLATSHKIGEDSFYAMVAPFLVGQSSPLYSVNGVFNAVFVHGNVLGDAMFYGSGAGKLPTASAVVADVVDEAKHLHRNIMTNWSSRPLNLMELDEVEGSFFVRVKETTVDKVEEAFGKVKIVNLKQFPGEFAFITDVMTQREYKEKAGKLNGSVLTMIRIKD